MYCCVHCVSGKEEVLCSGIRSMFKAANLSDTIVWFPTKTCTLKRSGKRYRVSRPIFPGYIFIYFNYEEKIFRSFDFRALMNFYKVLTYADGSIALRGSDLYIARWIHKNDGRIGISTAKYREGEKLLIVDGPMRGMEGLIVKVDRHHRKVWLRFSLDGLFNRVAFDVQFLDEGGSKKTS